jgi:hypothetical protein
MGARKVVVNASFGDHARMAGYKLKLEVAQVLLLSAAVTLSACHRNPSGAAANPAPQIKPNAPVALKAGATVAEQTLNMVEASAQGKSQLPVQLKFELTQRPKVGQALDINLALIPQVDGSPAIIKVTGGDGLTMGANATEFDIPAATAGGVYLQTVNVTPGAEGILILGVTVSLKHDEVTDLKSFAVPLIAER